MKRKNLSTENTRLLAHLHCSLAPTRTLPLKHVQVQYEIPLTAQLIVFVCLMTQNWTSINPCGADVSGSSPAQQQDEQRADSVLRPRECLRHAVSPPALFGFSRGFDWYLCFLFKEKKRGRDKFFETSRFRTSGMLSWITGKTWKLLDFKLDIRIFIFRSCKHQLATTKGSEELQNQMSLFTAIFIKDAVLWPPFEVLCFFFLWFKSGFLRRATE